MKKPKRTNPNAGRPALEDQSQRKAPFWGTATIADIEVLGGKREVAKLVSKYVKEQASKIIERSE